MTHDEDGLTAPYRPVRPVTAPADGPWPGMLTWLASGERRVLVDAAVLGEDWGGWDAAPDGHVLAPLDLVRRRDGHDVALPVCTDRLTDFLARRRRRHPRLTPGEAVTIGVSLLRGCAELTDDPRAAAEWWLTEAGRPILVTDVGTRGAWEGAVGLLGELSDDMGHGRHWDDAIAALTAERFSAREAERAEQELFACAEPVALATGRDASRVSLDDRRREDAPHPRDRSRSVMWEQLIGHVDGDLADLVSKATTSLWRRAREPRAQGRRRAPLVMGGAVAVAVLAVGLMWPTGEADRATAEGGGAVSAATATPTVLAESVADAPAADEANSDASSEGDAGDPLDDSDLTVVAGRLLDRRRDCQGDAECLATVIMDPSVAFPAGAMDLPASGRAVELLDDFGGMAVLRVDGSDSSSPSQLVVIVRTNDEWLLRDVHDVAQQP